MPAGTADPSHVGNTRIVGATAVTLAWLVLPFVAACASAPWPTGPKVDVPRFMGDWYVLGAIPASQEANAYNGVETYRLRPGTGDVIETTYVFRDGGFDGELVQLEPVGYVDAEGGGARWGMKFWWWQGPFRLEYLIAWLAADYTRTIIARSARDYVWIMARTPSLPEAEYERLVKFVAAGGYPLVAVRI